MTAVSLPSVPIRNTLVLACSGLALKPSQSPLMPKGGSVNQIVSSDFTTMSFGALSRLPSKFSASTVILPFFGTRDAARYRMLAGDEAPLAVARVPVGEIGRTAEDGETAVLLRIFHDAVVRDVADEQISAVRKIDRAFSPSHAACELFHRARVDAVFQKARIEDSERGLRIALVRLERKGLCAGAASDRRCRARGAACENLSA